ncbi:hypothetical protein R3P38DRAFT_2599145 [Favolaschia claudopus]|uniref:BRCT domain-containing protein n=1 Tax=Favolaschia claudopus TaxID=2862362 RepID=A0AAW0E287_9AGAR
MVFQNVRYHLPTTLSDERQSELETLLENHHATRADSVFDATHIITNSDKFEMWQEIQATKPNTAVVSELWVERSVSAKKLQDPKFYSASPSQIFSGVVGCGANLHKSDEELLSVGITLLGGQWRLGLLKDVTHLFAVSTNSDKYATAMGYRSSDTTQIKVLIPGWFDDSIEFGTRDLSTTSYEWPHPAIFSRQPLTPTQLKNSYRNSLSPQKRTLYKTASFSADSLPNTLDNTKNVFGLGRIAKNVWGGRRILLSTTLDLKGSRRKLIETWIQQAKGVPIRYSTNQGDGTPEEELELLDSGCDVLITSYRSGRVFHKAWREGKTIGTLSWLLNVLVTGVHSSPMDQLLHFPTPPGPVKGFENQIVSITNYTGEVRDWLKKLVTLMGGTVTPSFSKANTALVAAQMTGSKTDKANEWSIPVVNHTWLEDCFILWKNLTPATQKYVTYPAGVDFAAIVGERGVGADLAKIIDAEAKEQAEEDGEEGTTAHEEDTEMEDEPLHNDSQVSADESEVAGGLTAMDEDVDMDPGGGLPDDNDGRMSLDDEPPRRTRAAPPSTPKSATKSPATPKSKPKSVATPTRLSPRKGMRRLSPSPELSESPKPAIKKKIVVARPVSASKLASDKKGKAKAVEPESEDEASEDEPVVYKPRRNLVRRASGPADTFGHDEPESSRSSPRKALKSPRALNDSDEEEFPLDPAAFTQAPPKPKTPAGTNSVVKARRLVTSEAQSSAKERPNGKRKKVAESPRMVAATPTPPSSPLAPATPSPRGPSRRQISVVVPHIQDVETSPSAKKMPAPLSKKQSVVAVDSHRAAVSAPPRSHHRRAETVSESASSPASSVAAPENGAGGRAKRSAAIAATQRLHDKIMPDVLEFQNEMRNRGRKGRRASGRPDEEEESVDEPSNKRRKLNGGKTGRGSTSDEESVPPPPARPKARKSEPTMRTKAIKIMITKVDITDEVLKTLATLGAKVTSRATECTHLIVSHLARTEKFLCALTAAPYILTVDWANQSAAAERLLPEEDYLLEDEEGNNKFNFKLPEAVARARKLKGTLFRDHTFFITPQVQPIDILRNVIQANGGQTVTQVSARVLGTDTSRRHVISCEEDKAAWLSLANTHPIYSRELVLTCALRQEMAWDEFKVPGSSRSGSEEVL